MELNDRPAPDNHSLLENDQLSRIVSKQSILRDFEASKLTKEEFCRQRKISRSTFYRDLGRRNAGGFRALVDQRKNRTKKGIRLDDRVTEVILEHLVNFPKAPVSTIHTEVEKRVIKEGWGNAPTYDKVRRFCQAIAPDVLRQWADGRKVRTEEESLTVRRVVTNVNELWQTDFSEIPLWTFDPIFGPELFKPWLMGTIDAASRVVPATLVAKTIGAREAILCWKKGMTAKGVETCPFYGTPSRLSMDNSKVFVGDAWQSLVQLGVEPAPITNDSPEENGKQERWFRTLQTRLISHLDGFADMHRGKAQAAKKCIPYPLLQKLIDDFMLEYHLTEHRELKMTPWEYWHRGLADAHGLLVPTAEIDRCLRISRDVQVSPEGLHVDTRRFIGPFLEGRVNDSLTVRIPPEGPKDSVAVFDHGLYLGDALEYISAELAQEISTTRLDRTIAIDRLAKAIREKNDQAPPAPAPALPRPKANDEMITMPPAPSPVDNAPAESHDSLGPIPQLPEDGSNA